VTIQFLLAAMSITYIVGYSLSLHCVYSLILAYLQPNLSVMTTFQCLFTQRLHTIAIRHVVFVMFGNRGVETIAIYILCSIWHLNKFEYFTFEHLNISINPAITKLLITAYTPPPQAGTSFQLFPGVGKISTDFLGGGGKV